LLSVENPGLILVRRVQQPCGKKTTSLFTKKKGSSSSKPSTTTSFEEALDIAEEE
jgi:hypothetical protein